MYSAYQIENARYYIDVNIIMYLYVEAEKQYNYPAYIYI